MMVIGLGASTLSSASFSIAISASSISATSSGGVAQIQVGTALGSVDADGFILLKIDL